MQLLSQLYSSVITASLVCLVLLSIVLTCKQGYTDNFVEDDKDPPCHTYRMMVVVLMVECRIQDVRYFYIISKLCSSRIVFDCVLRFHEC
jgi:hypothetical protein